MKKRIESHVDLPLQLPIGELHEFQGDLASIEPDSLIRLKESIVQKGFIFPFFVWSNSGKWFLIDGHQRRTALVSLSGDGYALPDRFPCIEIVADSIDDARERLLVCTSQYKTFDVDAVQRWVDELGDFANSVARLCDSEISLSLDLSIPTIEKEDDVHGKKECVCPECGCRF